MKPVGLPQVLEDFRKIKKQKISCFCLTLCCLVLSSSGSNKDSKRKNSDNDGFRFYKVFFCWFSSAVRSVQSLSVFAFQVVLLTLWLNSRGKAKQIYSMCVFTWGGGGAPHTSVPSQNHFFVWIRLNFSAPVRTTKLCPNISQNTVKIFSQEQTEKNRKKAFKTIKSQHILGHILIPSSNY